MRRNAVKHGLRMVGPIVRGMEDGADWQRHLESMTDSLEPEGYHECVLVERISLFLWRTRRAVFYELAKIDDLQASAEYDMRVAEAYRRGILAPSLEAGVLPEVDEAEVNAAKARRILPGDKDLSMIMRYETHLHRMYIQTLHELEAIQARRRGERVPLTRLDISGPPAG